MKDKIDEDWFFSLIIHSVSQCIFFYKLLFEGSKKQLF